MRQAGRYLPEYQELRKKAGSFWTMCMTPDLAVEVTLQPVRRYAFDAAIVFSDILVVPYALGQEVRFEEGIGPVLGRFPEKDNVIRDRDQWMDRLSPVYRTIGQVRAALAKDKALIGFAGGPWTLAAYILQGGGSSDQRAAKLFAYRNPKEFERLLDLLVEAVAFHLVNQLENGSDAVQIFDSWAGGLPDRSFMDWIVAPTTAVVKTVREKIPTARIIGFPRAATQNQYESYARSTGIDCVGIDTASSMRWAGQVLGRVASVQGNLDPIVLIAGGGALDAAIDEVLAQIRGTPAIFNLGHGVLPETPLENVSRLVERVRGAA